MVPSTLRSARAPAGNVPGSDLHLDGAVLRGRGHAHDAAGYDAITRSTDTTCPTVTSTTCVSGTLSSALVFLAARTLAISAQVPPTGPDRATIPAARRCRPRPRASTPRDPSETARSLAVVRFAAAAGRVAGLTDSVSRWRWSRLQCEPRVEFGELVVRLREFHPTREALLVERVHHAACRAASAESDCTVASAELSVSRCDSSCVCVVTSVALASASCCSAVRAWYCSVRISSSTTQWLVTWAPGRHHGARPGPPSPPRRSVRAPARACPARAPGAASCRDGRCRSRACPARPRERGFQAADRNGHRDHGDDREGNDEIAAPLTGFVRTISTVDIHIRKTRA